MKKSRWLAIILVAVMPLIIWAADELTYTVNISFDKGGAQVDRVPARQQVTIAGDHYIANVQDIGTNVESILVGDLLTNGYMFAYNLDTNYSIEIGFTSSNFVSTITLDALQMALFPVSSGTLQARANTGTNTTSRIEYVIIEK